jgi:hypothetical protein
MVCRDFCGPCAHADPPVCTVERLKNRPGSLVRIEAELACGMQAFRREKPSPTRLTPALGSSTGHELRAELGGSTASTAVTTPTTLSA